MSLKKRYSPLQILKYFLNILLFLLVANKAVADNKSQNSDPSFRFNQELLGNRSVPPEIVLSTEKEVAARVDEIFPNLREYSTHEKISTFLSLLTRAHRKIVVPISEDRIKEISGGQGLAISDSELDILTKYFENLKIEIVQFLPERDLSQSMIAEHAFTRFHFDRRENIKQQMVVALAVAGTSAIAWIFNDSSIVFDSTVKSMFSLSLAYAGLAAFDLKIASIKTRELMRKFRENYITTHKALPEAQFFLSFLKISGLARTTSTNECLRVYKKN